MHKITPHLWYDKEAKEAAEFYSSIFKNSKINNINTLENTPSGSCDIVSINLMSQDFMMISAGPLFKFNPSVSFLVALDTEKEVDELYRHLSDRGVALLELGEYPFSRRYGWVQDRFGLSWQVMLASYQPIRQAITPVLMFTGKVSGKAEEAIRFYESVFHDSKGENFRRYGKNESPEVEGTIKFGMFTIEGYEFAAMDSARPHGFSFNEAISFIVRCENQKEIDYYWEKLSADPKSEMCGWLKDKFGLSWQVTPTIMNEMLKTPDKKKLARVTEAFLKMKKFDIETLKQAYSS